MGRDAIPAPRTELSNLAQGVLPAVPGESLWEDLRQFGQSFLMPFAGRAASRRKHSSTGKYRKRPSWAGPNGAVNWALVLLRGQSRSSPPALSRVLISAPPQTGNAGKSPTGRRPTSVLSRADALCALFVTP